MAMSKLILSRNNDPNIAKAVGHIFQIQDVNFHFNYLGVTIGLNNRGRERAITSHERINKSSNIGLAWRVKESQ